MTARNYTVTLKTDVFGLDVSVSDRGDGQTFLLLHGGAGPQSVLGFADLLASERPARVLVPTHPGFSGTPRPESLHTVRGIAAVYVALLDELDLTEVTVIGNSIGGWIAAEMALLGSDRISRMIIVDGVGIEVPGHPVADFFNLTFPQIAQLSYHDPERFRIDPDALPPAAKAEIAGNRAALARLRRRGDARPRPARQASGRQHAHARAVGGQRRHRHPRLRPGLCRRDPGNPLPGPARHRSPAAA